MSVSSKQELGPNQREWVNDLRSGKFMQTAGVLQSDDHYCCLGVGCVTAKRHNVFVDTLDDFIQGDSLSEQSDVQYWLRLYSDEGVVADRYRDEIVAYIKNKYQVDYGFGVLSLTGLNDCTSLNFEEIAEVIETFPHAFFSESK